MPRNVATVESMRASFYDERISRQDAAMFINKRSSSTPKDVFSELFAFASFKRDGGLSATLSFNAPGTKGWNDTVLNELLTLTRDNMRALYDGAGSAAPSWTWDDTAKRVELSDVDARYVIARRVGDGELLGFVHFRFVMEEEPVLIDALYVYELQLAAAVQRKGLGKHLMIICELIARKQGMHW